MKKYLFLVLIISGILLPVISYAGDISLNGPLVICGRTGAGQAPCTLCDVFKMIQKLIDWITSALLIIAAPILIGVGGFMILLSGGDPGKVSKGKDIIKNVVIGIIIALLAWSVVNMILNGLLGPKPIPWNTIECKGGGLNKTTPASTEQTGEVCRCEFKDGVVNTNKVYDSADQCKGNCSVYCDSKGNLINRYCCVENRNEACSGISNDQIEGENKQCACETDVYDISPKDYPSKAIIIAKDFKVTTLTNANECATKCVLANKNTYCYDRAVTPQDHYRLKCYSQNDLEVNKNVSCKKMIDIKDQKVACYNSQLACNDAMDPTRSSYKKDCWIDGQPHCECKGNLVGFGCTSSQYGLILRENEVSTDKTVLNVWSCFKNCVGSGEICGLAPETTIEESTPSSTNSWCKNSASAGSDKWILNPPPGGAEDGQKGDASKPLASFLNCMYGKLPKLRINSISENAMCANPGCDTTTTKCGSHGIASCHYGGRACTGLSYSVDFDTTVSCNDITTVAKQCDSNPWINWEPSDKPGQSHTHITISTGMNNCDCVDTTYGPGKACPK